MACGATDGCSPPVYTVDAQQPSQRLGVALLAHQEQSTIAHQHGENPLQLGSMVLTRLLPQALDSWPAGARCLADVGQVTD